MNCKIIGVDPGSTTGIAFITVLDDRIDEFRAGESTASRAIDAVRSLIHWIAHESFPGTHVYLASERFLIGRQTTRATRAGSNDAVSVIGGLRTLQDEYDFVELNLQTAADAKSRVTNESLKKSHLWTPRLTHGNDAMRHAVLKLLTVNPTAWLNRLQVVE